MLIPRIFGYLMEKAVNLDFFLVPAKTIRSSPSPILSPTEGQLRVPALDWTQAATAGLPPRPAFVPNSMPVLRAFVLSRALLWKGLLELVLAWLPVIIHALRSKLWPQIWQEGSGLQSEFSLAPVAPTS